MKKRFITTMICLVLVTTVTYAQITGNGTITYKKTTNMHMMMKVEYAEQFKGSGVSIDDMIKMIPKYSTQECVMTYNREKSMYRFDKTGPEKLPSFGGKDPASENIVYKNFKDNTYRAQKDMMDETYIIEDSIPQYTWKISDEIRVIAGYTCRKATTVILDSLTVVAFYTDDITVSSGPESFGGLPGMILGLAVPRLYTTWFATEVRVSAYDASLEKPLAERRVKKATHDQLIKNVSESVKEWGAWGANIVFKAAL